jgi:hypothetical protein
MFDISKEFKRYGFLLRAYISNGSHLISGLCPPVQGPEADREQCEHLWYWVMLPNDPGFTI